MNELFVMGNITSSKITSPETQYKDIERAVESSKILSSETEYKETIKAVESGDNKAKTNLAYYKLSGYGGCEIDVDEAVALLKERVEDKDTDAMWLLGLCYEYGMGCEQDLKEAESLYKQSDDGGNDVGRFFMKYGCDERGTGVMNVVYGL